MPRWIALFDELGKADPNVTGKELAAATDAKVVRVRDGQRIVTDGPFAVVRNPIYSGMIPFFFGLALLVPNVVTLAG